MQWLLVFLLYCSIINLVISFTYIGNEDSLRQNIVDLYSNKLVFSEKTLPFYKGELTDITPENNSQYDFIIIGAGSAGAVVAARLSEIENVTVLLIEAGPEEYPLMDIPALAGPLELSDQINWGYRTESSNKYCRGFEDSRCTWPRGKVTGGSSTENYMVATRGNKANYNQWAWMTGDESWSYKNMLKYFKKLEDVNVNGVNINSEYRNKGGPMHISSAPYRTELTRTFIKAGKELGFPEVDYNGEEQIGFSYFQSTVINGERWTTNRAYLHPVKNRTNLFFTRNTFVNKILIDEYSKLAYGVEMSKSGRTFVVNAKREVILCGGAINSPQILMLSGIGPAEHLVSLGIKVIKNAPVGQNLMDHPVYGGLIFKTNVTSNPIDSNVLDSRNPSIKEYINERNGTLALGAGFEALSFVNVDNLQSLTANPNIELIFGPNSGLKDPTLMRLLNVSKKNAELLNRETINDTTWSLWTTLMQPKSRGILLLRSKNPHDKPKIYPNYYNHPDDVRVMIKGLQLALEISKTKAFKKYDSQLIQIPLPCEHYLYNSYAYWECALRTYSNSLYHPSGTCKMGHVGDPTAVVNSKLQVIGIRGLRVIDASIMPNIVSGHTNIPTIAIAEKASDVIKKDWGYLPNCL